MKHCIRRSMWLAVIVLAAGMLIAGSAQANPNYDWPNNMRASVISALGLLSLLKKEIGSQLSSDGRFYLGRLQNSLVRLETLVDDSVRMEAAHRLPR